MKNNKLEAGDTVSHRGNSWIVNSVFGGLVKIICRGESKTVRLNQVAFVESLK